MVKRYLVSHEMGKVLGALRGEGLDVREDGPGGGLDVRGVLNGRPFAWSIPRSPHDRSEERALPRNLADRLRACGLAEPVDLDDPLLAAPSPSDIWWAVWAWEEDLDGGPVLVMRRASRPADADRAKRI